uniref:Shroom family member 3 n=1 Tax=Oryzias latipes TaxID=8090 RepID=A0A3P9LNI3_ORYLA
MEQRAVDTMSGAWPHSYHASASTTNLCGGFDSGEGYLRKSPDQYSSRGSMESLDPPQSSQFHSVAQSSSSIDHLHSKRDSAYSSFSTSSSIPEYFASTPSFSPERCYSLETVPQRAGGSAEMLQADMRCVRSVHDDQQGLCQEPELSSGSASTLGSTKSSVRLYRTCSVGVCYRGNSSSTSGNNSGGIPAWNRHSVGPIWGPTISHSSSESLKGAPAPPRRSDSFAAIRNHERPNSWSSLENARSLRSLQKGSWHHSSGPVAPVSAKGSYGMEGQLHTVIEKSPESSPTTKPRQGGGFLQPPSPTRPSASPTPQSARTVLPTSVFPVAQPEPHYAHMPSSGPGPGLCGVEESSQGLQSATPTVEGPPETRTDERNSHPTSLHKSIFTQERKSHHAPLYSWGDQNRYSMDGRFDNQTPVEQSSTPPEPVSSPRLAQGQVPPSHVPKQPQPLAPPSSSSSSSSQPSSRHFSDSAAPLYQHWDHRELDRDNPLTRLEIALAEVQRCASPDAPFSGSNHDNSNVSDVIQGPARSLSVLEKVSRFERRDYGGRQRSLSTNVSLNRAKGRSSPCGADDLRSMLERSTKGTKAHRTMSYRGGSDPMSALQRSRSSFQLDGSNETETNKDFPWRQDIQEAKAPLQDASSNSQLSSVPAKCPSLEKKGPKTMPKPQGIVITPQSPPPLTSPHTPKERHAVSPDVRGPSPPALPRVPPVGLPALMRICGRRRLTADQKKRSYSEPENMNEVGVSDSETLSVQQRFETSVADRRKMFELAARHGGSQASQGAPSRSDLRQAQQDALAEYVERKRGAKRGGAEGQRGGSRPHSVYLQPEYSGHTGGSRSGRKEAESIDVLQKRLSFFSFSVSPDTISLSASTDSTLDLRSEGDVSRQSHFGSRDPNPGRHRPTAGPQSALEYPRQPNGALGRAGPPRRPGKSASAEDLLERLETKPSTPHHHRSRSSPASETLTQFRCVSLELLSSSGCALFSDPLHTPVARRDRPRNTERPRAQSASMLAASVGLPCPFSPQDTAVCPEWKASERLSRANLEAISFPDVPHSSRGVGSGSEALQADRQSNPSGSTASPPASPLPRHLSSLRISESSLCSPVNQQPLETSSASLKADLDEVFLQSPPPPPPPPPSPPSFQEITIPGDFPPPPPLLEFKQEEPSLARLLDPWRGKSTVELMEEIFPNSPLTDQSQCLADGALFPPFHCVFSFVHQVELCEVLRKSVVALQQEKEALCEEQRGHKALGASIEELVQERLKTNEKDKYSMFIGDLERIVNLLLSLCSRLSRIDRSLLALEREELMMEDDSLHHKRSLLLRQTEDARELKENLDRRQRVVHTILSSYLTEAQLQDYRRFVSTKPSLLIRLRHLDELVRLREQQLAHLNESAWPTDRLLPSPAPAPPLTFAGPAHSLRSTAVTSL